MYIFFIRSYILKVKGIVQGKVRVLNKGRENLFHFLDETTVANHDHSAASFSLSHKKSLARERKRRKMVKLREGK
jgi:hypothetical protein